MRKEWISYLHFQTRRAEQKSERKRLTRMEEKFEIKNPSHRHFYNFYSKFYNHRGTRMVNYLW